MQGGNPEWMWVSQGELSLPGLLHTRQNPGCSFQKCKMPFLLGAVEPHQAQTLAELVLCPLSLATNPVPAPLPFLPALGSLLFLGINESPSCARRDFSAFFTKAGACQLLSCVGWEHPGAGLQDSYQQMAFPCLCF